MSDLCRDLVLWAWSRRPDQVSFTPAATDRILAEATRMGRLYHPSIPLVEPSDQRLKIARLAAAAAARTFSTPDGEQLVVDVAHVDFVTRFLERAYESPSLAYGEFSEQQRKGESLTETEAKDVETLIDLWDNREHAIEFFRSSRVFKKADLTDVVGWETDKARMELRMLSSRRLIRPIREGYMKTPAFISFLRRYARAPIDDDEPLPEGGDF